MRATPTLKAFVEEVWARFRATNDESLIVLLLANGHRLEIEENAQAGSVTLRYFLPEHEGRQGKDLEIVLYVTDSGEWIPVEQFRAATGRHVYGDRLGQSGDLVITDVSHQEALALYCNGWAFYLRAEKWLQQAANLYDTIPKYTGDEI